MPVGWDAGWGRRKTANRAVDPVGVETMSPSERRLKMNRRLMNSSNSIIGRSPLIHHHVVEGQVGSHVAAVADDLASSSMRFSAVKRPSSRSSMQVSMSLRAMSVMKPRRPD